MGKREVKRKRNLGYMKFQRPVILKINKFKMVFMVLFIVFDFDVWIKIIYNVVISFFLNYSLFTCGHFLLLDFMFFNFEYD